MKASDQSRRGRPRDKDAHHAILRAALQLVSAKGFRAITVDEIAAKAQVGKMTLYRRWPNKSSVVMDSLLELVGPQTEFPSAARALDSLRAQLHLQAKFFRGRYGRLVRSLLAEAQSNEELARAFRDRWIAPRRQGVIRTLEMAIAEGDLRPDINLETTTDLLYGPLYYRLLLGTGKIGQGFVDNLLEQFLNGHARQTSGK